MPLESRVAASSPRTSPRAAKLIALLAIIAALVVLWVSLPISEWLISLAEWIRGSGAAGVAAFAVTYIVATVALAPGTLLTLAAGFAWGPVLGTLIVLPTATLAAVAAFLVGRFLARGWVARKVRGHARLSALDRALGTQGFRIVLLLRLSPIFPFNLLNYALGLTQVRLLRYTLASFAGMLPGTAMYVYLGSLVTTASQLTGPSTEQNPARSALYWVGLAATVIVTILVTRLARAELKKQLPDAGDSG